MFKAEAFLVIACQEWPESQGECNDDQPNIPAEVLASEYHRRNCGNTCNCAAKLSMEAERWTRI
jgi:hypothetical protein